MRNIIRVAVAAGLAAVALLGTIAPAQAAEGRKLMSGLGTCLDVPYGNFRVGQEMWVVGCSQHIAQKFVTTVYGEIRPKAAEGGQTPLCLDVPDSSTVHGRTVRLWECNGSLAQKWKRDGNWYRAFNGAHDLCLDVAGGSPVPGTKVITWDCIGGDPQNWFWYV